MSEKKLLIEDGTIENYNLCSHRRGKSWVAVVEKDKSQPGGLRREFLSRVPGGRVFIGSSVAPGAWMEFAGDYYTSSGRKDASRDYWRVIEVNGYLTLEACDKADIGKMSDADPVNPLLAYSDDDLLAEVRRRGLI